MIDFGKSKNIINKKCKLILKRCSSFIIFILSYSLYFFSLEPCVIGDDICGNILSFILCSKIIIHFIFQINNVI